MKIFWYRILLRNHLRVRSVDWLHLVIQKASSIFIWYLTKWMVLISRELWQLRKLIRQKIYESSLLYSVIVVKRSSDKKKIFFKRSKRKLISCSIEQFYNNYVKIIVHFNLSFYRSDSFKLTFWYPRLVVRRIGTHDHCIKWIKRKL